MVTLPLRHCPLTSVSAESKTGVIKCVEDGWLLPILLSGLCGSLGFSRVQAPCESIPKAIEKKQEGGPFTMTASVGTENRDLAPLVTSTERDTTNL